MTGASTFDGRTSTSGYTSADKTLMVTSAAGRVSTVIIDELGRVVSSQYGDLAPAFANFNERGQLVTLSSGTGDQTRVINFNYGADGFRESVIDPLGRAISYERDAVGRITKTTLPGNISITTSYNEKGEFDALTPPGKPEHGFTYTLHGNLDSITPPFVTGSGATTFDYNEDRQLITISSPGEEQMSFIYDTYGRIHNIEWLKDGAIGATYTLNYLASEQLDSILGPGAQTVSYTYQGDLVTGVTWGGVVEGSYSRMYDSAFRLASESVNGGTVVEFGFDDDDLLAQAGAFSNKQHHYCKFCNRLCCELCSGQARPHHPEGGKHWRSSGHLRLRLRLARSVG
jgi:YD repeat-containing protein